MPRALAEDLRRFLRSEPILARRAGWSERLVRWARRRPAAAVLAVALPVGLLMALALVGEWLWQRQQQAAVAVAFDDDLHEVAHLGDSPSWAQARVAAERARGRVAVAGTDGQRARADRAIAELDLATRLERARLDRHVLTAGSATRPAADREYLAIFRDAGLADVSVAPADVAARVMASVARRSLVEALDDWATATPDAGRAAWCLQIASLADPDEDDWRRRVRDRTTWRDKAAVAELARTMPVVSPPTSLVINLADLLALHGGDPTEFLKRVQLERPADFWVNFLMANALARRGDGREAIAYYRAALAARPDVAVVSNNLAFALKQAGRLDEAIAQYEHAIRVAPRYAEAYCNLGIALKAAGKPDAAITCFRRSVELKPTFAGGHNNLGNALKGKGDLAGAAACYETAARLDPTFAEPHFNLALIADKQNHRDDAIHHYEAAVRINPNFFQAHSNLGRLLVEAGRVEDGLGHLRQAVRIAPGDPVNQAALAKALHGQGQAGEAVEHMDLSHRLKKEFLAAARLYAEEFTTTPALASDWPAGHRSRAAGAAALVGCSRGTDQGGVSAADRARWRQQALEWLRADLAAGERLLTADPTKRAAVRERLTQWRDCSDLAGVRDAAGLEALPGDERHDWERFWSEADALLRRAGQAE